MARLDRGAFRIRVLQPDGKFIASQTGAQIAYAAMLAQNIGEFFLIPDPPPHGQTGH